MNGVFVLTKRFIAGATCQKCHQSDTTRVYYENGLMTLSECVECGHRIAMDSTQQLHTTVSQPPKTRITREESVLEPGYDLVRIIN